MHLFGIDCRTVAQLGELQTSVKALSFEFHPPPSFKRLEPRTQRFRGAHHGRPPADPFRLYETSPNFRSFGSAPLMAPEPIGSHLLPLLVTDPKHQARRRGSDGPCGWRERAVHVGALVVFVGQAWQSCRMQGEMSRMSEWIGSMVRAGWHNAGKNLFDTYRYLHL